MATARKGSGFTVEDMLKDTDVSLRNAVTDRVCREYYDFRKANRWPLTKFAWSLITRRFTTPNELAIAIMFSIERGYRGVFVPSDMETLENLAGVYKEMLDDLNGERG